MRGTHKMEIRGTHQKQGGQKKGQKRVNLSAENKHFELKGVTHLV